MHPPPPGLPPTNLALQLHPISCHRYVLRYLSKAQRVQPTGVKRGAVRQAVEGARGHMVSEALASSTGAAQSLLLGGASGLLDGTPRAAHLAGEASVSPSGMSTPLGPASPGTEGGKGKQRGKSAGGGKSRPSSALSTTSQAGQKPMSPARMLMSAGNSAVMKELALLSLTTGPQQGVVRTGGGFSMA